MRLDKGIWQRFRVLCWRCCCSCFSLPLAFCVTAPSCPCLLSCFLHGRGSIWLLDLRDLRCGTCLVRLWLYVELVVVTWGWRHFVRRCQIPVMQASLWWKLVFFVVVWVGVYGCVCCASDAGAAYGVRVSLEVFVG